MWKRERSRRGSRGSKGRRAGLWSEDYLLTAANAAANAVSCAASDMPRTQNQKVPRTTNQLKNVVGAEAGTAAGAGDGDGAVPGTGSWWKQAQQTWPLGRGQTKSIVNWGRQRQRQTKCQADWLLAGQPGRQAGRQTDRGR